MQKPTKCRNKSKVLTLNLLCSICCKCSSNSAGLCPWSNFWVQGTIGVPQQLGEALQPYGAGVYSEIFSLECFTSDFFLFRRKCALSGMIVFSKYPGYWGEIHGRSSEYFQCTPGVTWSSPATVGKTRRHQRGSEKFLGFLCSPILYCMPRGSPPCLNIIFKFLFICCNKL